MKNLKSILLLVVTFLLLVIPSNSYSQIQKGTYSIGGNIFANYQSSNQSGITFLSYNLSINPNIGYFISDKTMVGIGTGFTFSNFDQESSNYKSTNSTYTYSLNLFYRKYWFEQQNKVGFFMQTSISPGIRHSNLQTNNNTSDPNSVVNGVLADDFVGTISINPGIVYLINPHLSVETTYGNLIYTLTAGMPHMPSHSVNLSFNISTFNIGFRYYFGRK